MELTAAIRSGLVITPLGPQLADVGIRDGRIVDVAAPGSLPRARREFDAEGLIVFPGLIDPHVHLGLGDTIGDDKMAEDFLYNTKDCLIGGVTTIATTTMEGREPLRERFDRALRCADGRSWVDYKITSVVGNRSHIPDIRYVVDKGGVSFKFFTGLVGEQAEEFGQDPAGITPSLFFEACEGIAKEGRGGYAAIHAEEPYVRAVLADRMGNDAARTDMLSAWADSSPEWAESAQVYTYAFVAASVGVPLYVVHVSSGLTVDLIEWLQGRGLTVVGETISLFLLTTANEMDQANMGAKAKISPPVRYEPDRLRLWRGLRDGSISIIGTDSLTYSSKFKEGVDFWDCRVGANIQFADMLPLLWDEGVVSGRIDTMTLARALSENAARRLRLFPRKGAIAPGSDADLAVFDPERQLRLGVSRYRGTSDYSLWEGREVHGTPVMTFLRGDLVMKDGEVVTDSPGGKYLAYRIQG
jgi:dihydroorotase-like cyclic amidohydrolase